MDSRMTLDAFLPFDAGPGPAVVAPFPPHAVTGGWRW